MKCAISVIVCFVLLLCLFSCKKKEDSKDPVITFYAPVPDLNVMIPDTLFVDAQISDDRNISSIKVSLVNEDDIPVSEPSYFYPNTGLFRVNVWLEITSAGMESGDYWVLLTASDGYNTKKKYQPVKITGMPHELIAYLSVGGQFNFQAYISRLSLEFESDTQFIAPGRFHLSAVNSLAEKLFYVTDEPSRLLAYDTRDLKLLWEMSAAPPRPLITDMLSDHELIFSTANGNIAVVSGEGQIRLSTMPLSDKSITCLDADSLYLYAAHRSLSGLINQLTVFYRKTGALLEARLIDGEIKDIVAVDHAVLVFNKEYDGVEVMHYDPENLLFTKLSDLQGIAFHSAMRISDSELLLLCDDRVYYYEPWNDKLGIFTTQAYSFARFEPLNQLIYLVAEKKVSVFDFPGGNLVDEHVFDENIFDFQLLYNK